MKDKIKVIIVDDHQVVIEGLKLILSLDKKIELVGSSTDCNQIESLIKDTSPDIAFIDVIMPEINGVELSKNLLQKYPLLKIIKVQFMFRVNCSMSILALQN